MTGRFSIALISLIVVAASLAARSSAQTVETQGKKANDSQPAATPQSAAQEFIELLQKEKFDDATKRFDTTMRKALSAEQLQGVWRATTTANGALRKVERSGASHAGKWDVVDTPCEFEKAAIVVRISLDKDLRVGGLYFIPVKKRNAPGDGPEVELKTATGTLFGTFDLPTTKGPWPVVLVIAGSGPTDRDGNQPQMKNDCLRLVGKALAAHGIAALRYDKRGIANSSAAGAIEENLRFENYVDDTIAWVKQLRADNRFNKVFILGHSEGSLIGLLAAKQVPVDGLVSVSGAGRDLAALLRDQLKHNLPANLSEQSSHMIDELVAGRRVKDVPPELTILFRPSVQPFLMTWLKYDPAKEIAGLNAPILVVQGTTDLQTSVEDAKLLAASNKNGRLVTIENMNHVLKNAPSPSLVGQAKAYSDPSVPLEPRLVEEVVGFVQKN
jgi:pimeloyl-ACP methyl ester carboxylesterase